MKKKPVVKLSEKKKIEFDILYKSLISNEIEIIESNNKNQIGIKGVLVHESANLFYIRIDKKIKKILKNSVIIRINYKNQKIRITGSGLLGTLTQRIKKIK